MWSRLAILLVACLLCGADVGEEGRGAGVTESNCQIPLESSSPGWLETPRDMTVRPGTSVFMRCRSSLPHRNTYWVVNCREDITTSSLSPRATLLHRNTSLRLGPLQAGDRVVIGCQVVTRERTLLPSPLATVSVLTPPQYSARTYLVAVNGQPFEMDMGYSGSQPPDSVIWMKDGLLYQGDGVRVQTTHEGITFRRVLPEDAGRYTVTAQNREGTGQAYSVLRVLALPATSPLVLSPHLALWLTLAQRSDLRSHTSPLPSSEEQLGVMAIIRRLLYHARPEAVQQGSARVEMEEILEQLLSLIGSLRNVTIPDSDMEILNNATNCTAAIPKFDCTKLEVLRYRTYDGTCNNFFYPLNGAALTAFPRLLPAAYEDEIAAPVGHEQASAGNHTSPPWPSARFISWKVVRNSSSLDPPVTGITHMVMQWGQFLDHDLDLSPVFDVECGCVYSKQCIPIHVNIEDGTFGNETSNSGKCLSFSRSVPACQMKSSNGLAREQINQVTSFIDASQVYGSSQELAHSLRAMVGGLLKHGGRAESDKGNLPFQKERPEGGLLPFFIAGDERANEQTGLTVMHTLWLREHNRIARALAGMNPCWNDERLYQEARKIVAAQMQKITFDDFLPVLFGPYIRRYVPAYRGYNAFVDASIPNVFAAAAYRFGHSLIRDQLLRLDENFTAMDIGHLELSHAFFNPVTYFESLGTDSIARGLMLDVANPVDEFLNSVLTSKLFSKEPGKLGGDLASLNIQRGRDHGLPSYRTWRRFCNDKFPGRPASFRDQETKELLRRVYGDEGFRNGIDLWVGGLAEDALEGAQVGPTLACILGLSFSRLRDGDRFWFESFQEFSTQQRRTLKQTSLARVVCDNGDDIRRVSRNVFRSSSRRVDCEQLPQLDLWKWKDYSC